MKKFCIAFLALLFLVAARADAGRFVVRGGRVVVINQPTNAAFLSGGFFGFGAVAQPAPVFLGSGCGVNSFGFGVNSFGFGVNSFGFNRGFNEFGLRIR